MLRKEKQNQDEADAPDEMRTEKENYLTIVPYNVSKGLQALSPEGREREEADILGINKQRECRAVMCL